MPSSFPLDFGLLFLDVLFEFLRLGALILVIFQNLIGYPGQKVSSNERMYPTYGLKLVELGVGLIGRLVRPCFGKNLLEAHEYLFLMKLVAVELEAIDELLDGSFGLEGQ